MHNVYNDNPPDYLSTQFYKVHEQHQHFTRNSSLNYVLPRARSIAINNFSFQGTKIWNNIPENIKIIQNKQNLKKHVKSHIRNCSLNSEQSENVYY